MNAEPDRLPCGHLADAVRRHAALEAHAGRVDDLHQLLAHRCRIARRDLAVADDAVEGRAHFRAVQLLARGHHARARRCAFALRAVAPDLDVLELLRRDHPRLAQLEHALVLTLGLFVGLRGSARRRLRGRQAVADGSLVEAHQQVAAPDRIAVLLEHGQHHRGHFRAQVGAAFGFDRTRDRRPGRERTVAHVNQVLRRDQQGGDGRRVGRVTGISIACADTQ